MPKKYSRLTRIVLGSCAVAAVTTGVTLGVNTAQPARAAVTQSTQHVSVNSPWLDGSGPVLPGDAPQKTPDGGAKILADYDQVSETDGVDTIALGVPVAQLAASSDLQDVLVVSQGGEILVSHDGGATATQTYTIAMGGVGAVSPDGQKMAVAWASAAGFGIAVSDDAGDDWHEVTEPADAQLTSGIDVTGAYDWNNSQQLHQDLTISDSGALTMHGDMTSIAEDSVVPVEATSADGSSWTITPNVPAPAPAAGPSGVFSDADAQWVDPNGDGTQAYANGDLWAQNPDGTNAITSDRDQLILLSATRVQTTESLRTPSPQPSIVPAPSTSPTPSPSQTPAPKVTAPKTQAPAPKPRTPQILPPAAPQTQAPEPKVELPIVSG